MPKATPPDPPDAERIEDAERLAQEPAPSALDKAGTLHAPGSPTARRARSLSNSSAVLLSPELVNRLEALQVLESAAAERFDMAAQDGRQQAYAEVVARCMDL